MSDIASSAPSTSALTVRDLTVSFPIERHCRLIAVDDVGFDLAHGESLGIVGESGCGKTTVARCVVGLQRPDSGSVTIDGVDVDATRSSSERRAVQLIFQDPYSSLNPRMTIGAMLTQLLSFHDLARGPKAEERCRELLALVGLPADALTRYPGAFSGGQRQRIAIARALAVEPRVIVADEPVSALDVSIQATILELFADLRDRLGISLVMISHNLAAVRHVCDRVAVMYLGKLVEVGSTEQVFADPRHPYTRSLLNAVPQVRRDPPTNRIRLAGEPPSPLSRPTGCSFHPRCPRAEARCAIDEPALLALPDDASRESACFFRDERMDATLGARVPEEMP
ncbi:MAG TPA: oligopeptide/dipeptide ABC transporter ATP-binding protein [Acidimicrobiales bacterium]